MRYPCALQEQLLAQKKAHLHRHWKTASSAISNNVVCIDLLSIPALLPTRTLLPFVSLCLFVSRGRGVYGGRYGFLAIFATNMARK